MSDAGLSLACPAKVNLSLEVVGRRDDGYHEIRTVFQAIDVHDVLEIRPASDLRLRCAGPVEVPEGEDNLVVRAARVVARRLGRAPGADLRLIKRIPVGGGLGGGSSNAAGAILGLERLWGRVLDPESRVEIAASVGADVPFFLRGGRAVGRGRGDRVSSLPGGTELILAVGVPPFGASTAEVFEAWSARLTPQGKGVSVARLSDAHGAGSGAIEETGNDLEAVAFVRWPVLRRFRDGLRECGAGTALLSGSGSSVYGVFDTRERRDRAAARLQARFPDWNVLRTRSVPDGVRMTPLG